MKKTKLFGTRIIENIQVPRTPKIIMFDSCDSINNMKFDLGDLLDANSIKKIIKNGSSGAGGSYNTDDLNAAIKALEKEINVLPIDEIVSKVGFTYNTKIDKFSGGVVWDELTKMFYAVDNGFYYTSWASYDKYPSSDIYNNGETKIFQNIFDGKLYRFSNGIKNLNELALWKFDGSIVQQIGSSETSVMSQKAVTEFVKSQFVLSTDDDIEQMIADGSWVEGQFYYTAE